MTQIAIYSDVHGDHHALSTAFGLARSLGCTRHLCCGDLVDEAHGADEVIDFARAKYIQCIRGNHERWFLASARITAISAANRRYLETLPHELNLRSESTAIAVHHGQPGSDMAVIFPEDLTRNEIRSLLADAHCDILIVGHTHLPMLATHASGGLIVNPGALGRPPYIPPAHIKFETATFGVLTLPDRTFDVYDLTGQRVPMARTSGD